MRFVTKILTAALALLIAAELIPGISVDGLYPAIIAALILGILNFLVRPVLIILTLPITLLSMGLFILVINALLFWFAASFIAGFSVDSFFTALLGSVFVSILSLFANRYIK